jgi:prepilin-type N-terminal cleavage/methylation domain-containing protein
MRTAGRRAFTLVEVLVAIALFAIISAVLYESAMNGLLALDALQRETEQFDDLRFVRSQILQEADLDEFEEGGEVETLDSGTVRWEAIVEPTATLHLFRVELFMEFPGEEGSFEPRIVNETLHLLRPTWSEPADATELLEDARERITDGRNATDWL